MPTNMGRKRRRVSDKGRRRSKVVDHIIKYKGKYNLSEVHLNKFVEEMYSREEAETILRLVRKDLKDD